jgi:hypothetical protein
MATRATAGTVRGGMLASSARQPPRPQGFRPKGRGNAAAPVTATGQRSTASDDKMPRRPDAPVARSLRTRSDPGRPAAGAAGALEDVLIALTDLRAAFVSYAG